MIHDRVSLEIDYPVLPQGTGPRTALLDEFKDPNCVLFATSRSGRAWMCRASN